MTRVTWDDVGSRHYTTGLDRGMLYDTTGPGETWDGLISVDQSTSTKIESIYYDGSKLNDIAILGEYEGSITAYRYPDSFEAYQGVTEEFREGTFVTGQNLRTFNLSYRSHHGDDVTGLSYYRIHIVYNVTAIPQDVTHNTISDDIDAIEFKWDITAVPERISGIRPSAHIILDSKTMNPLLLSDVEDILYGYDAAEATMPSMRALLSLLETWDRLIIVDNDDGTWTAIINREEDYTDLGGEEFEINADNVVYLDAATYTVDSSDRITEDV